MTQQVLHVARAFSAQPTLGVYLADADVVEAPLDEALGSCLRPDLIWVSVAEPQVVAVVRDRFPGSQILATPPRRSGADQVVALIAAGADLVLQDEGVLLAAAGLNALSRRPRAAAC